MSVTPPDTAAKPRMNHRQVLEALSGLILGMFVSMLASTVVSTSLGLRISYGSDGGCDHWSLSGASPATARALARAVVWLRRPEADAEPSAHERREQRE